MSCLSRNTFVAPPLPDRVLIREQLRLDISAGRTPQIIESSFDSRPKMSDLVELDMAKKFYVRDHSRPPEIVGWYWNYSGPGAITVPGQGIVNPGDLVGDYEN